MCLTFVLYQIIKYGQKMQKYRYLLICEILEYKKDIKDVDSAKFFDDLASLNNIDNKRRINY